MNRPILPHFPPPILVDEMSLTEVVGDHIRVGLMSTCKFGEQMQVTADLALTEKAATHLVKAVSRALKERQLARMNVVSFPKQEADHV